jgi:predicted PurR-regulated permease PerM
VSCERRLAQTGNWQLVTDLHPLMSVRADASRRADELDDPDRRSVHLPLSTIVKVLVTLFALWALYELRTVIALVLIAVVLAIAFEPAVVWMEHRRVRRWVGSTLIVFVVVTCLVAFMMVCGSVLADQGRQLTSRIDVVQQEIAERVPAPVIEVIRRGRGSPDASVVASYAMWLSSTLASALLGAAVAFILTIYFLIEGRRTWQWLVAYVPRSNRARVQQTADAGRQAVRHYVIGNVATSLFAGGTVFIALTLLHVPAALLLAVLAFVCDFVPVLGFIVSSVPAVLLALTVSSTTALFVAVVYVSYHMVENYLIGPKVYGGQLRLSNLAVLLAFAVGAELFGILGALLALPVAAMYPCVEDVWLRDYLGRDAVETHRRIEKS